MRTCSNVFFYFGCGDSDGGWCSVGFGIYDVHSTRVPSEEEMRDKLKVIVDVVKEKGSRSGEDLIFVNPVSERMQSNKNQADIDFFFFTGLWKETEASLRNLVKAAQWARQTYG